MADTFEQRARELGDLAYNRYSDALLAGLTTRAAMQRVVETVMSAQQPDAQAVRAEHFEQAIHEVGSLDYGEIVSIMDRARVLALASQPESRNAD